MKRKNKKPRIAAVIIIVAVLVLFFIPVLSGYCSDGGSKITTPLIPLYGYIEYHELAGPIKPHDSEQDNEEANKIQTPSYIGGHGIVFLGMGPEIVFDKYEVYPDGHRVKISEFAINWG